MRPAQWRLKRPGRSLRLARSPVAPKRTITWSSGRLRTSPFMRPRLDRRRRARGTRRRGRPARRWRCPATSRSAPRPCTAAAFSPRDAAVHLHERRVRHRAAGASAMRPSASGMNLWPERPGWMLMQSARSAPCRGSRGRCALDLRLGVERDADAEPELASTCEPRREVVDHLDVERHAVAARRP